MWSEREERERVRDREDVPGAQQNVNFLSSIDCRCIIISVCLQCANRLITIRTHERERERMPQHKISPFSHLPSLPRGGFEIRLETMFDVDDCTSQQPTTCETTLIWRINKKENNCASHRRIMRARTIVFREGRQTRRERRMRIVI